MQDMQDEREWGGWEGGRVGEECEWVGWEEECGEEREVVRLEGGRKKSGGVAGGRLYLAFAQTSV